MLERSVMLYGGDDSIPHHGTGSDLPPSRPWRRLLLSSPPGQGAPRARLNTSHCLTASFSASIPGGTQG
jgi:hypothetical protein